LIDLQDKGVSVIYFFLPCFHVILSFVKNINDTDPFIGAHFVSQGTVERLPDDANGNAHYRVTLDKVGILCPG
jgi:hypothetical protein